MMRAYANDGAAASVIVSLLACVQRYGNIAILMHINEQNTRHLNHHP
jgi:hypothetical protein